MRQLLVFVIVGLLAFACAPAALAVQPTPISNTPVPTATTVLLPPPAQPPAGPGQEQVSGRVAAISSSQITLEGGKSYTLAPNTRYSHPIIKSYADLKKGDFVAITAQTGPTDSSL